MKKIIIILIFILSVIHCEASYAVTTPTINTEVNLLEGIYKISSSIDNNMVLSIINASRTPSANVQLEKDISSPSQYFAILKEYDGWYLLKNVNSQFNLDVTHANPESETNLQQWPDNKNDAQHFKFYDAGNQHIYIQSKLGTYIDLTNGETDSGNNIQLYEFNGSDAQKWTLSPISQSITPIDIEDGNYVICSESIKNSAINITNSSKVAGTEVQAATYTGINAQTYKIEKEVDGWYSIKNVNSKLYLDIRNASKTASPILQQWIGNGQHSQKFKFYDGGNDSVIIGTKYGTVLDISDSSPLTENHIQLNIYTGTSSQLWCLKYKS